MKNPFKIPNRPTALPIRPWCSKNAYTWKDWERDAKAQYPIRYFLSETLPDFWRYSILLPVTRPISKFWSWVKCHVIPKHRYHMLDLRQPEGYRYGWIDADTQMVYACFNILVSFIEEEHGGAEKYLEYVKFQEEDILEYNHPVDEALQNTIADRYEVLAIYHWWTKERLVELQAEADSLSRWNDLYCLRTDNETEVPGLEEAFAEHECLERENVAKETRMITRLIALREYMWT